MSMKLLYPPILLHSTVGKIHVGFLSESKGTRYSVTQIRTTEEKAHHFAVELCVKPGQSADLGQPSESVAKHLFFVDTKNVERRAVTAQATLPPRLRYSCWLKRSHFDLQRERNQENEVPC